MIDQTLFDMGAAPAQTIKPARRGHPQSRAALDSIKTGEIDGSIVRYMRENFNIGWTCDDLEVALGLRHQTASSAVWRLKKKGLIVETSQKRKTRSGRNACVLVLKK